ALSLLSLSLPLRWLGALLRSLAAGRTRLLLTRTVVLNGLAVRPLRLLARRRRPQLLLLRLERPRDARARGRIGAAEVALLGDDLPAHGLRQMHLADEAAVARDLLCGNRGRHRGKAHDAGRGCARPDGKAARALGQRAEPRP